MKYKLRRTMILVSFAIVYIGLQTGSAKEKNFAPKDSVIIEGKKPVSFNHKLHLDLEIVFVHGCLGPRNIDGPRIEIPGRYFAVSINSANFDDIPAVGPLPTSLQWLEIDTVDRIDCRCPKQCQQSYDDPLFWSVFH